MTFQHFSRDNNFVSRFGNLFLISLFLFTSCTNRDAQVSSSRDDTTKAIQLAIKTILEQDFPEAPAMKKVALFHDSIFVAATNSLPLASFPDRVNSLHLKVLADTLLCASMRSDTSLKELPNYLKLDSFENRDSGYFVKFESLNCMRGEEGGSVGIFIVKTKDNFVFKK